MLREYLKLWKKINNEAKEKRRIQEFGLNKFIEKYNELKKSIADLKLKVETTRDDLSKKNDGKISNDKTKQLWNKDKEDLNKDINKLNNDIDDFNKIKGLIAKQSPNHELLNVNYEKEELFMEELKPVNNESEINKKKEKKKNKKAVHLPPSNPFGNFEFEKNNKNNFVEGNPLKYIEEVDDQESVSDENDNDENWVSEGEYGEGSNNESKALKKCKKISKREKKPLKC